MALTLTKILREAIKKRLPPAIVQHYQKLDYTDKVTDQILQREYSRCTIQTDPSTEFLITNNRIQKSLAYQMVWDGYRWTPKLTKEEYLLPFLKSGKEILIPPDTTYTIIKLESRNGHVEYIEFGTDQKDMRIKIVVDDIDIIYCDMRGGTFNETSPYWLYYNHLGDSIWDLTLYDDPIRRYKINLRPYFKIIFKKNFHMYVRNAAAVDGYYGFALMYRLAGGS